ncbi:PfkB family carbohydrate kinase [Nonomuraea thailandensis]|uniref:PfkB family carbohydrate kinase n=1 Tax=Nonomuraea thailandensis TaxID=1188745 RepID=UPI003556F988
MHSGESDHYPAHPVEAVDVAGASDAFAAGLLWEVGNGSPLQEGIHRGLAWAAATVGVKASVPIMARE